MQVKVKLFATFRENREKEQIMDLSEQAGIRDVLQRLEIAEEDVAVIFVNGRGVPLDHTLSEDDTLSLFPPVGGG